jgi:putative PIN family toxin of toxin-antitoxin system
VGEIKVVKVVIDTNVLISALLFGGVPGRLLTLWKTKRIQPVVSQAMIDEYLRVLAYPKFQLSQGEIEYLLYQEILPWFETIVVSQGGAFVQADPSDDKFIWCAEAGEVDWIISGDDHLLGLQYNRIPIVTPASFLGILESGK